MDDQSRTSFSCPPSAGSIVFQQLVVVQSRSEVMRRHTTELGTAMAEPALARQSSSRVEIASRSRLEVGKQHSTRVSLMLFSTQYYCQLPIPPSLAFSYGSLRNHFLFNRYRSKGTILSTFDVI